MYVHVHYITVVYIHYRSVHVHTCTVVCMYIATCTYMYGLYYKYSDHKRSNSIWAKDIVHNYMHMCMNSITIVKST